MGTDRDPLRFSPLSGGDINRAYRLSFRDGTSLFIKKNSVDNLDFFRAEAEGLEALGRGDGPSVPSPLGYGRDGREAFLLLPMMEAPKKNRDYWERFGRELARLHRQRNQTRFGFSGDNYIGATPQKNGFSINWIDFFRSRRLEYQIELARDSLDSLLSRRLLALLDRLDDLLDEPDHPSLLHGDLWGGNVLAGSDGAAWLIDPAVYYGHREADLAMTELFGSFPSAFYGAYHEIYPIDRGYKQRRDLYNLYHMLNHLNLFGQSYLASVRSIVDRY